MRVRTGKVIKAISLLGNQTSIVLNNFYSSDANRSYGDGEYVESGGGGLLAKGKLFNLALNSAHTYLFIRLDSLPIDKTAEYTIASDGSVTSRGFYRPDNTNYTLIWFSGITEAIGFHSYRWGGDAWTSDNYPISYSLLDLTETFGSGKEPTAQQFYNKYKDKLELLATGNEIVIDSKSGKIMTEDSNEDIISCNVAVKEYGYNQLCELKSLTSSGITFTPTSDCKLSITGNIAAGGNTAYYTYSFLDTTHKYYFKIVGQSTTSTVDWYCGGEYLYLSSNATQELIRKPTAAGLNINVRAGFSGPYEVQISCIDLTWWYGPGKEPSTVQEFKEKFPNDYYGFCSTPIKLTKNMINAIPVYGYNQIISPTVTPGANWGTASVSSDGVITYTVTGRGNSAAVYRQLYSGGATANHKYYMRAKVKASINTTDTVFVFDGKYTGNYRYQLVANTWTQLENMVTVVTPSTSGGVAGFNYIYIQMNDQTAEIGSTMQVKDWQFIDLTEWYGAGSEPSTVEEFKATFPYKYYQYCKKSLLNKYQINALGNN